MSIKPVKGLRSYYPSDKGPVDTYQLGRNGRVEYLAAEIAVDHLRKGKETNEECRKWAKERGNPNDEPGLILSNRLGGDGQDKTNLFPKGPRLDETIWKEHEQAAVDEAEEMRKWKKIKFSVRLDYPTEESTRPSALEYQYDLPSGTILYGKVNNEAVTSQVESTQATEEEEEEEEEVEEEEEEEEEAEEEEEEVKEEAVTKMESGSNEARVEESSSDVVPSEPVPEEEEPEPVRRPIPIIETIPPTPRPSILPEESSPSPPPEPEPRRQSEPEHTPAPPKPVETNDQRSPEKGTKEGTKKDKPTSVESTNGVVTKSDLIELIPVIGSCKLAMDTVTAAYNGNGKLALRKAAQCCISLVADFYLGRAIARHGKILANSVTEQTIIRFVSKAENQIIIVSTFKATNQLLNTLTRAMS